MSNQLLFCNIAEEMGVLDTARDLLKSFRPAKPPIQRRTVPKVCGWPVYCKPPLTYRVSVTSSLCDCRRGSQSASSQCVGLDALPEQEQSVARRRTATTSMSHTLTLSPGWTTFWQVGVAAACRLNRRPLQLPAMQLVLGPAACPALSPPPASCSIPFRHYNFLQTVTHLSSADGGDIESMPEEKQEQFQEMRCGSMGRGSVYDSTAGEC
jgi:hypothetical protein